MPPTVPRPIPYQGSKRLLSARILRYFPERIERLVEPFAGSAAVTLAAAAQGRARRYLINDSLVPLARLWHRIIHHLQALVAAYERLWHGQLDDPAGAYYAARRTFNESGDPDRFYYLLARCVKAAVRFNAAGEFNQSPDNRRLGARPHVMQAHILAASALLRGRAEIGAVSYTEVFKHLEPGDFLYLDPPYQGVSGSRDPRYCQGTDLHEFLAELATLNTRQVPYALSFDGRCGAKVYGQELPPSLGLTRLEIVAGRSSQATLLGRTAVTTESLYLSPALIAQTKLATPSTPAQHRLSVVSSEPPLPSRSC